MPEGYIILILIFFLFVYLDGNNIIFFLLAMGRRNKSILCRNCSRLRWFVHHVVRAVKLDAEGKMFVLTTFSGFIGLCRISMM